MHAHAARTRRGFTLIELIIVVVVLGILAAVATPKFTNTSDSARENAAKQTLSVLRNAIEVYKTEEGSYPAAGTIETDLADYIRGDFPSPGVGSRASAAGVGATTANPPSAVGGATDDGWLYNASVGEIWINDVGTDSESNTFMSW